MYATERHALIERLIAQEGRVRVVELARRFDVTTETVRRDLGVLEDAGALRRVHGGAVHTERASTAEPSLSDRLRRRAAAKAAIAERALGTVAPGFRGSLFIDAGTTTAAVATQLAPRLSGAPIDIVTHALPIAHAIAGVQNVSLTLIGGRVRGPTAAAVGAATVRTIDSLRPDIAFVGTNGVSPKFGLSTPDSEEAAVKAAIIRAARRVVVVADAEKFDRDLLVSFAGLSEIDVLVTDAAPQEPLATALAGADVEVWCA